MNRYETTGIKAIAKERRRQIVENGWTPEHDDKHARGQLAAAAACYALFSDAYPNPGQPPAYWPFEDRFWKPEAYRRDLEKAGAMIAAEIDRLDRMQE